MRKNLLKRILDFREQRDWQKYHTPNNLAASLVIEASEALEALQWKIDNQLSAKEKLKLEEELADVYYYLLLLAHDSKIDLESALDKKMTENENKYPVEKIKGNWKKYTEI